jgi:enamine deaminase RidA (YjgF/YER057c/UK114 family)
MPRNPRRPLLLPLCVVGLLVGCAVQPPAAPPPPPPPSPQYVVPKVTEYVSELFGYSQAVRIGPWVTTSTIPGFDIQKRGFPEDFESQVHFAFENLKLVLEAAGASMDEVVELSTQQIDMEQFNATVDGKMAAFGEHKPTWIATGVKSLPLPSMQIQVSARAWSPHGKVVRPETDAVVHPAVPAASPLPASMVEPAPKPASKPPQRFMNRPGY